MTRIILGLIVLVVVAGCHAPCFLCSTPEPVAVSMKGQIADLRIIEKELVDAMPAGAEKDKWKNRMAAFITESRGTLAWATKEDFNALAVLEEERKE